MGSSHSALCETMSAAPLALSVLDLVPVRTGQTSAQAIAASLATADAADRLGYRRYWFAEHHNMPAVASTTPPVLVAAAAARTAEAAARTASSTCAAQPSARARDSDC